MATALARTSADSGLGVNGPARVRRRRRLPRERRDLRSGKRLPRHSHPQGCIAVVVEGVVDKAFARVSNTASQGSVITMPPEEPHVDTFGRVGARLVVVESPADEEVALTRLGLPADRDEDRRELESPIPSHRSRSRASHWSSPRRLGASVAQGRRHGWNGPASGVGARLGFGDRGRAGGRPALLARAFHERYGASMASTSGMRGSTGGFTARSGDDARRARARGRLRRPKSFHWQLQAAHRPTSRQYRRAHR